jgi:hypothetical protein
MDFQFPKTVAAALKADATQWDIGDALLKEAKGDKEILEAAADELATQDIHYAAKTLGEIRRTAENFKSGQRDLKYQHDNKRHKLAFTIYVKAGDPETLQRIIERAEEEHEKVTRDYAIEAMDALYRDDLKAEAVAEEEEAAAEEEAAVEEERKAEQENDAAEQKKKKEAAKKKRAAAKKKREAAKKKKAQAARRAPKRKKGAKEPEPELSIPGLGSFTVLSAAGKARRIAEKMEKLIEKNLDDMTEKKVAAWTLVALEAMEAWKKVADLIRSRSANKRGHLRVVNQ